jgi:digeranylgeranylglycerophospholipid reductase
MQCDFLVVGGGPVGSTFASLAARSGSTVVVEEHERVGIPVQCTGLVSPRVVQLAGAEGAVLNELKGVRFHFPGGRVLRIVSSETKALVVDREAFDLRCAERASAAGATYLMGARLTSFSVGKEGVSAKTGGGDVEAKLIVGADGFKAQVGRAVGIAKAREQVRGIQVDIDHRMPEQEVIDVFLGTKVAPGFFAWLIPCDGFTRVGLCVSEGNGAPNEYLGPLLNSNGLGGVKRRAIVSGIIPIGPPTRTYADRTIVVGDAAGHAKPLSGGGLYPGLIAARAAAETAAECLEADDFSARALRGYQGRWRESIGKELDRGAMIRKAFVRMSDKKLDEAGGMLDQPDVVELLATGDIDNPGQLAPQILRAVPSLVKFAPHFLGALVSR